MGSVCDTAVCLCLVGLLHAAPSASLGLVQVAAVGHELKYTLVPRQLFTLEVSLHKGCPLFPSPWRAPKTAQSTLSFSHQCLQDISLPRQCVTACRLKGERFQYLV